MCWSQQIFYLWKRRKRHEAWSKGVRSRLTILPVRGTGLPLPVLMIGAVRSRFRNSTVSLCGRYGCGGWWISGRGDHLIQHRLERLVRLKGLDSGSASSYRIVDR
jgi:hypothetical protein